MDRNVLSYPSYIVHFILGEVPRLCLNIHQVTSEPLRCWLMVGLQFGSFYSTSIVPHFVMLQTYFKTG